MITRLRLILTDHRFARFLLIGMVNTAFGTALFWLALAIMPTLPALVVSTVIAVLFNFMTTGTYVFRSREPRLLVGFFGVYGIVLIYNAIGLTLLADVSIGPRIGVLLLLPGAVAISYLLNRGFVFRSTR